MRKKIWSLFTLTIIVLRICCSYEGYMVFAENPASLGKKLLLDNENIYDGMEKAYSSGYEPYVSDDMVTILLPLYEIAEGDVDFVRATPDLNISENSPFIPKNYQKTVLKTTELINGGADTKDIFLIKFQFSLLKECLNGVYPVKIHLYYESEDINVEEEFMINVTITDGIDLDSDETEALIETEVDEGYEPDEPDEDIIQDAGSGSLIQDKEEKASSEPKLIILKHEYRPDRITAGSSVDMDITIKNTSKIKATQNITISIAVEGDGILLLGESNIFFYEKLGEEETLTLPLKLQINEKAEEGKYAVDLEISYDNEEAVPLTAAGKAEFAVYRELNLGFEAGELDNEINAGDSVSIAIQAMNLGRGVIYNARCQIEAAGLSSQNSLFLGNINGGEAASGEMILFAGIVNPEAENEKERYGKTTGRLILTYEDEEGNSYTQEHNIATTIQPLNISNNSEPVEEEVNVVPQLAAGMAAVVIIVVAGTGLPQIMKWRRKKINDEDDEDGIF